MPGWKLLGRVRNTESPVTSPIVLTGPVAEPSKAWTSCAPAVKVRGTGAFTVNVAVAGVDTPSGPVSPSGTLIIVRAEPPPGIGPVVSD